MKTGEAIAKSFADAAVSSKPPYLIRPRASGGDVFGRAASMTPPNGRGFAFLSTGKRTFVWTFFILSFFMSASAANAAEVDGIVARVGTEAILRSDVLDELRRAGQPDEKFAEIRNRMIDRKLILKAATESKMTMQEWVIENRIREIIKKGFDGDRNKLMDVLSRQKISYPEWRARMKEDMIVQAMRYQVVDKNVTASPAELRKEYAEHKDKYASPGKVSVSVITLPPSDSAKREEISKKVKDLSFVALGAKEFKDIEPEDNFNPTVCAEIAKMPKGTISHWLEIDGWSFLIRKDDESPRKVRSFEEAIDDIDANVKEETAKRMYSAWLERLRAETYVKVY